jgi:CTP:molybdopterin cytidylyltransferase MocA
VARRGREAVGRHPGPQRGGSIGDRRASRTRWAARAIDHEILVDRRRLTDARAEVVALAEADRARALLRSPYRNGFGFAVRAGLEALRATRWRS